MSEAPSETLVDFVSLENKVFLEKDGVIFIGQNKITPQIRDLLREQAKGVMTSQLWEIINATITNEAASLALLQSTDFEQVRFAKALHHWNHVMKNMIYTLSK